MSIKEGGNKRLRGRPRNDHVRLVLRVSPMVVSILEQKAQAAGLSKSGLIEKMILSAQGERTELLPGGVKKLIKAETLSHAEKISHAEKSRL
jgi:hypothetical protein